MRWIFWFLLIGNLGLVVWHFLSAAPSSVATLESTNLPIKSTATPRSLQLLSELQPKDLHPRELPKSIEEPVVKPVDTPKLCRMVGPFKEDAAAKIFLDRLKALEIAAVIHPVELSIGEGYWVHLQPSINREESRRRLAELQGRGIDSFIIPKGDLENGISLGVFTQGELAKAKQAELIKQGLEAKIHETKRTVRELWLMLMPGEDQKLDESMWSEMLRQPNLLQERQNLCSEVASDANFH